MVLAARPTWAIARASVDRCRVWLRRARMSWLRRCVALQEAAGDAQQVVVVVGDQGRVEAAGERVEPPVVGDGVKPPEAGAAGIDQPRGELVAQESEEAEDDVGVAGRRS